MATRIDFADVEKRLSKINTKYDLRIAEEKLHKDHPNLTYGQRAAIRSIFSQRRAQIDHVWIKRITAEG